MLHRTRPLPGLRRLVTGHDGEGQAVVQSDTITPAYVRINRTSVTLLRFTIHSDILAHARDARALFRQNMEYGRDACER